MENMPFNNISGDAIEMQQDEITNETNFVKKVKFNEKNYLNTKLSNGETSKKITIRLLPISSDSNSAFLRIRSHYIRVNAALATESKKNMKGYVCCKHTPELHEKYGDKCAICDAHDKFIKLYKEATNPSDKKMYEDLMKETGVIDYWVVRCIERGKEDEGVKFWKFPASRTKKGIYDTLISLYLTRKQESIDAGDEVPYNIFDLNNGKDIVLTITSGNDKTSITVVDAGRPSPLSKDMNQMIEWVNDEKKWTDVYGIKSYDYLKIVLSGEVPYYDKEQGKFVPKSEIDSKKKEEKEISEEEIIKIEKKLQDSSISDVEDEGEDLPF